MRMTIMMTVRRLRVLLKTVPIRRHLLCLLLLLLVTVRRWRWRQAIIHRACARSGLLEIWHRLRFDGDPDRGESVTIKSVHGTHTADSS